MRGAVHRLTLEKIPLDRPRMAVLTLGDLAPEFELKDHGGTIRRLSELRAGGPVVLFFYPKDETAICTKEACGFRDEHARFLERGAQVVGISRDSVESHAAFRNHHQLPFLLLSDPGGKVADLFCVKKTLGLLSGRATFVVDVDGMLRLNFASALSAQAHIDQALATVRALARPEAAQKK